MLNFLEPAIQETLNGFMDNCRFQNYLVEQGVDFEDRVSVAQASPLWDIHATNN